MQFGKELFQKKSVGQPTFSPQVAGDYFAKLYHDEKRDHSFDPLPEMKRPPLPQFPLFENPPTKQEIAEVLRLKRNCAAPGPNGISYVPYKRCPALIPTLQGIFSKVWKSKDVPPNWASASVLLLSKSEQTSNPAEFRPIALTNTIGKIFFSIFSKRLESFMLVNKFTSHSQKGFKAYPGLP